MLSFLRIFLPLKQGNGWKYQLILIRGASLFTGNADRLEIQIKSTDIGGSNNTLYIDDIVFGRDNDPYNPVTSSPEFGQNNDLRVYPNPAFNQVLISSVDAGEVSIYSMLGGMVKKETKVLEPHVIDLTDIPNGMYIVCVKSEKGTVNKKLQVVR